MVVHRGAVVVASQVPDGFAIVTLTHPLVDGGAYIGS